MKVKCINNHIDILSKKRHKFAYTQDSKGVVDLELGKIYQVYGIRKSGNKKFFLLLTETIHYDLPWWMPADFFEIVDDSKPTSWYEQKFGLIKKDIVCSSPYYFDAIDAIEDGSTRGKKAFVLMRQESE
jgi:hypothetical protein